MHGFLPAITGYFYEVVACWKCGNVYRYDLLVAIYFLLEYFFANDIVYCKVAGICY